MKLSVKARYGLAAVVNMARGARGSRECVTLVSLSERLSISKIYLEQVFSLLKRGGVVTATKGAQGGYRLARPAGEITALDVISAIETSLFERTEETAAESDAPLEAAMARLVFDPIDKAVSSALSAVTIGSIAEAAADIAESGSYMFYL